MGFIPLPRQLIAVTMSCRHRVERLLILTSYVFRLVQKEGL